MAHAPSADVYIYIYPGGFFAGALHPFAARRDDVASSYCTAAAVRSSFWLLAVLILKAGALRSPDASMFILMPVFSAAARAVRARARARLLNYIRKRCIKSTCKTISRVYTYTLGCGIKKFFDIPGSFNAIIGNL